MLNNQVHHDGPNGDVLSSSFQSDLTVVCTLKHVKVYVFVAAMVESEFILTLIKHFVRGCARGIEGFAFTIFMASSITCKHAHAHAKNTRACTHTHTHEPMA